RSGNLRVTRERGTLYACVLFASYPCVQRSRLAELSMSKVANRCFGHRRLATALLRCATVALGASVALCAADVRAQQQAGKGHIPELASSQFAWLVLGVEWFDPPPGTGHGPIKQDPDHPYHGNRDGAGQVTVHLGNYRDPVLKPWAAKQMREAN